MATLRMDHVSVVVDELQSAIAFFSALGMELEGEASISGDWLDRLNALDEVRVDIALMRTPDGSGKLELTKFRHPEAVWPTPDGARSNAFGLRSVMFEVDDVAAMVVRLREFGGRLIGEQVQYESEYRLAYVRGPGDALIALAESLRKSE